MSSKVRIDDSGCRQPNFLCEPGGCPQGFACRIGLTLSSDRTRCRYRIRHIDFHRYKSLPPLLLLLERGQKSHLFRHFVFGGASFIFPQSNIIIGPIFGGQVNHLFLYLRHLKTSTYKKLITETSLPPSRAN